MERNYVTVTLCIGLILVANVYVYIRCTRWQLSQCLVITKFSVKVFNRNIYLLATWHQMSYFDAGRLLLTSLVIDMSRLCDIAVTKQWCMVFTTRQIKFNYSLARSKRTRNGNVCQRVFERKLVSVVYLFWTFYQLVKHVFLNYSLIVSASWEYQCGSCTRVVPHNLRVLHGNTLTHRPTYSSHIYVYYI